MTVLGGGRDGWDRVGSANQISERVSTCNHCLHQAHSEGANTYLDFGKSFVKNIIIPSSFYIVCSFKFLHILRIFDSFILDGHPVSTRITTDYPSLMTIENAKN